VTTARPKVFVGTPTANGVVTSDTALCVTQMIAQLREAGIGSLYRVVDGPNLMIQRDMLAQAFLSSDCTHLLLVDANMRFQPDLCARLLAAGQPLVGAIVPRGAPDLARLGAAVATMGFDAALARAYDWDVELLDRTLSVQNGFCRVRAIGSGFVLVSRDCLARLAQSDRIASYAFPGVQPVLRAFFRYFFGDEPPCEPGHAFALRWHATGGPVWAYAAGRVGPVAEMHHGVPFSDFLAATGGLAGPRTAAPAPAA
jgi:hypothetical protein